MPEPLPVLKEIAIESRWTDGGRGRCVPHLVVSLECLAQIFALENSVIAEQDVGELVAALCGYAIQAGHADQLMAEKARAKYQALAYCGVCECAPCECENDTEDP